MILLTLIQELCKLIRLILNFSSIQGFLSIMFRYLLTGTIFSNLSCRLIVAQMSSTTCETFHWMNPILLIAFIASLFIPRLERLILYSLLIFSTITHWYYGANLVEQMCEHFNRICFGVGKRRETINEKK